MFKMLNFISKRDQCTVEFLWLPANCLLEAVGTIMLKTLEGGYHAVFLDWLQIFRDLWKSWFPGQGRAGGN